MIWEHHTEQGHLVQSIVLFKEAFAASSTVEPQARLPHISRRAVAQGCTNHPLGTCSRVLVNLCRVTKKPTSKFFNIKLAFEEEELTICDHDQRNMLQLTRNHTALSW